MKKIKIECSWGLGNCENNVGNAYGLLWGLLQAKEVNIKDLMVMGDSQLIIHHLVHGYLLKDFKLWSIIGRIRYLKLALSIISFFHELRMNNYVVDHLVNKSVNFEARALMRNDIPSLTTIHEQCVWYAL